MSQVEQYLVLGGVELVNGCRTGRYFLSPNELPFRPRLHRYAVPSVRDGDSLKPCCCEDLIGGDSGIYGTGPDDVSNPAPWYDINLPASSEFFGFILTAFQSPMPLTRTNSSDFSKGRAQATKRTFSFRLRGIAGSIEGSNYGMFWLSQALRGLGNCTTTCEDSSLTFYRSCDLDNARTVYGVGLVSLSVVEGGAPALCDGFLADVVLEADVPWLYGRAFTCITDGTWEPPEIGVCSEVWRACPPVVDLCALPIECRPTMPPPPAPPEVSTCWCEPEDVTLQCCSVPAYSDWVESVLTFELYAGTNEMRNARINLFENPNNYPCPDAGGLTVEEQEFWDSALPYTTLEVIYLPPDSILIVDGRDKTIKLMCGGAVINGAPYVSGPSGSLWSHPVISACTGAMCACVALDGEHYSTDANLTIVVTERELSPA